MPDEITNEPTDEPTDVVETPADPDPEGAEALGDPGKKALDAMKAERKALKEQLRAARAELDNLKAPKSEEGEAPNVDAIKAEAERAATAKANERIIKAEVKAASAGKLADPSDAFRYLDVAQFDVDENGNVDAEEIADAVEDLIKTKPYLAATVKRFQGTADQGASSRQNAPAQLTRDQLKGMSPEQINKARSEGRLNKLLGIEK